NESLFWDIAKIYNSIILMLKKCKEINKIPESLGIDTFGVDYCLLDCNDQLVRNIYSYRDSRTIKAKQDFEKIMSIENLYKITGIYPQVFNTLYQLYDDKEKGLITKTKTIMFLPCYLGYLLTDVKYNELSIASTSGLLNKDTFDYDKDILKLLGLNKENFANFKNNG
ncbi:MAG TPA: rhamnulokinase, partial [Firmicutes bacterium]|nr:rhamnulokinase [Bacillota bacterium]